MANVTKHCPPSGMDGESNGENVGENVIHSTNAIGTSLSLASTFIVGGHSKQITALPSHPAVARLPKHLSHTAARALLPNLQVLYFILSSLLGCVPLRRE